MLFFSLFYLACAILRIASATPIPISARGIISSDNLHSFSSANYQVLEARGKDQHKSSSKPQPPSDPIITLESGDSVHAAANQLKDLNLYSKNRKIVVDYHVNAVAEAMKDIPGAHSAVIKNLAHSVGSHDPNVHISATIKDVNGNIIEAPRLGNPNIMDPTKHIYVNKEDLPIQYTKAVDKKLIREGKEPGRL